MPNHANARDVLPPELLKEVQKHFTGNLWVPQETLFFEGRKELVIELHKNGTTTREIAHLAGVTVRRINQILAEARQEEQFSGMNRY